MNTKNRFILGVIFFIIVLNSCIEKVQKNRIVLYADQNKTQKMAEGEVCGFNECGIWLFYSNGIVSDSGYFDQGLKSGIWRSKCNDQTDYTSWEIYKNKNIEINYPENWVVIPRKNRLFLCVEDTMDKKTNSDVILVTEYENDSISFEEIIKNNKSHLVESPNVINYDVKEWNIKGKKAFDFFVAHVDNSDTTFRSNLIIEAKKHTYNVLFITHSRDDCYIQNIYRSLITGIKIDGRKLIYAYETVE